MIARVEGALAGGGLTLTQFKNVIRAIVEDRKSGCRT
jgi:hypothetical protein